MYHGEFLLHKRIPTQELKVELSDGERNIPSKYQLDAMLDILPQSDTFLQASCDYL